MRRFFLLFCFLLSLFTTLAGELHAETFRSSDFTIQTDITPVPTPFQPTIQIGFTENRDAKPIGLTTSNDRLDYGPITPANPIKRKITISVDYGSSQGANLLVFANHPLMLDEHAIADTSCDNGSCDEKSPAAWLSPLTFGLGFSYDDRLYQQFPDNSKKEAMSPIQPGEITTKLNVAQSQYFSQEKFYTNSITFLLLAKY